MNEKKEVEDDKITLQELQEQFFDLEDSDIKELFTDIINDPRDFSRQVGEISAKDFLFALLGEAKTRNLPSIPDFTPTDDFFKVPEGGFGAKDLPEPAEQMPRPRNRQERRAAKSKKRGRRQR